MKFAFFGASVLTAMVFGSSITAFAEDATAPLVTVSTSGGFDWTGFYAGLSYGTANGKSTAVPIDASEEPKDVEGNLVGIQGGYNWQNGNLVYGFEAAVSSANVDTPDTRDFCFPGGCEYVDVNRTASISARVGLAMDRTLVYGKLGYSTANVTAIDWDAGPESETHNHRGTTFGIGLEQAFSDHLSGLIEYSRTSYSTETYDLGTPDDVDFDLNVVRLGVNYRF